MPVERRTGPPKCIRFLASFLSIVAMVAALQAPAAWAQDPAPETTPNQVRLLIDLLSDPAVREWLDSQRATAMPPAKLPAADMMNPDYVATRMEALRQNIRALAAALPRLRAELARVGWIIAQEFNERGTTRLVLQIGGVLALAFGVDWAFRRASRRPRAGPVRAGLGESAARLAFDAASVAIFAIVATIGFLAFDWPPHLRTILVGYLIAFVALRLAILFFRFLLAPADRQTAADRRFPIVPVSDGAARLWHVRLSVFAGWFAFGFVTVKLLEALGIDGDVRRLVAYALGLGLVLIGLELVWRRADRVATETGLRRSGAPAGRWLLSAYLVVVWLSWIVATPPRPVFWLIVIAGALPLAIGLCRRAVGHLFRAPDTANTAAQAPNLAMVAIERGISAGLIICAAIFLADRFGIDIAQMTAHDTLGTRLVRGALSTVVIVLIADVIWHLLKAVIDRKLIGAARLDELDTDELRRRQRLKTLLPIFRNIVLITLLVIVALTVLSAFGIEIGPLIAGAGVIGVAIGFGAQTLVKDIISGMFYLLDDAFRIGEYIQSDKFKGTVESFSLRSVKLRHHRGYLFTVPFGELGAVENMSRDWVIDKLTIGVTYDSDLDKAKKIVKEIGRELAQDPEYGQKIIEPLKMQGVEQFGDFAVQLRLKMKTKPGEQFVIRRRAYALIKKAFEANGIKFAFPTVQVAGGEEGRPAVAKQALDLVKSSSATP